jgi:TatD DNase family protein
MNDTDFESEAGWRGLFDTHAHLSFLDDRGIDGKKCAAALFGCGFAGIIDIGTVAGDLRDRIRAFSSFASDWNLRFAAGIWPWKSAIARTREQVALLERELEDAPEGFVVAIGECGFDRRENPEYGGAERALLEAQLDLARRKRLPVIIHSREAPAETIETLAAFPDVRGVIHCFSYTDAEARTFVDMGYAISFAGNITYKNAHKLRDALQSVPLNSLLLETDSPFLAPVPYRGKPAHPGMLLETYRCAAGLLKIGVGDLKEILRRNAEAVFPGCGRDGETSGQGSA